MIYKFQEEDKILIDQTGGLRRKDLFDLIIRDLPCHIFS